ncbi:MAG TPA: SAM-dependent methyltransferase, partial [Terrabacter sp.]|nr:SAM-dependent methyltransferase [Terrabacter sp.]
MAFVGSGPGDPGLMTLRGRDLLAAADVVVLDRIARDDVVLRHARPDVEIIDAGHGEQGQELTQAMRAKLVVKAAKSVAPGGLVVRLMDGDPATFNGLVEEVRACRKAGITYDVVPGVSALTAGPTYAGVPLTSKSTGAVHVVGVDNTGVDYAAYATDSDTLVLLGSSGGIRSALEALRAAGRPGESLAVLSAHGTTVRQS